MKYPPFPKVMGIINVTPDSFSDGGAFYKSNDAIRRINQIAEYCDIFDIGGESTRPGSKGVSEKEELNRVLPIIEYINKNYPDKKISIDTTKYNVAEEAINKGAHIINDVSGLEYDIEMGKLAAEAGSAYIIMHMQGTPRNMQKNPKYENVVENIFSVLNDKVKLARELGIKEIYADPGIGFGKILEHNIEILKNISRFKNLNTPLLLGISRKSFIGKLLNIDIPEKRDTATLLIHSIMLFEGIEIIRIHSPEKFNTLKKLYNSIFFEKK